MFPYLVDFVEDHDVAASHNGDVVALELGMVVASVGGAFVRARADSMVHSMVQGIAVARADLTLESHVIMFGHVNFPIEVWEAVVEEPGGLVPSSRYFLSVVPGKITSVPPTGAGTFVVPVGTAFSTTKFVMRALHSIMQ